MAVLKGIGFIILLGTGITLLMAVFGIWIIRGHMRDIE